MKLIEQEDRIEIIEEFIKHGQPLLPSYKKQKFPCIKSWNKYSRGNLPCKEEVFTWRIKFGKYTNSIIPTGKNSQLIVIDLDGHPEYPGFMDKMKSCMPPSSFIQKSGKGYHLFYQYSGESSGGCSVTGPHAVNQRVLDLQSSGKCIVLAPSLHESGRRYEIIQGSLEDLLEPEKMLPLPLGFIENLDEMLEQKFEEHVQNVGIKHPRIEVPSDCNIGYRNQNVFNKACELIHTRMLSDLNEPFEHFIMELISYDLKVNNPPWFSDKTEHWNKGISTYESAMKMLKHARAVIRRKHNK